MHSKCMRGENTVQHFRDIFSIYENISLLKPIHNKLGIPWGDHIYF
jgi:hypothetical protein